MKKILLSIAILLSTFISNAQIHLCYDVYYYKNPKHVAVEYKNILVMTNASYKCQEVMKKYAIKRHYNITFSSELFPPIKNYTDEEISKGIKDNNIDAIFYYNIKGSEVISTGSYGTYTIPNENGAGRIENINYSVSYTSIEGALVLPDSKDQKEFYCSGGATGKPFDSINRTFDHILIEFTDARIALPVE